jgi:hypothetical protein
MLFIYLVLLFFLEASNARASAPSPAPPGRRGAPGSGGVRVAVFTERIALLGQTPAVIQVGR